MHIKGDVIVKILIDKDGKLISARAICEHPLKMCFAKSAVIKWKFKADTGNGKARKAAGMVTVHFPPEDKG